jgi:SAM-dependent methyltransferase
VGDNVLDVGCGRENWLLDTSACTTTGLDPSEAQLNANPILDERVVGSVETYECAAWASSFDLVIASYVLEHLSDPTSAIEKMVRWTKASGRIVVAVPNISSLKGYVTKYTPLFVHRWFYKLSLGENAPQEDAGPFPTFLRPVLRVDELDKYLEDTGLRIDALVSFESFQNAYLRRFIPGGLLDGLNRMLVGPLKKDLSPRATDLLLLISKKPEKGS